MKKNLNPNSPEVIEAVVQRIQSMTRAEALEFLTYRTPGIEQTNMTGMLTNSHTPDLTVSRGRRASGV